MTEYASDNLRVRVRNARGRPSLFERAPTLLCAIEIENTRDVWAGINAERSCVIDPKMGTTRLLWRDEPLPPKCWTTIDGVAPGFINVHIEFFGVSDSKRPVGGTRRVLLNVIWDDEVTESVDLTYEVKVKNRPVE